MIATIPADPFRRAFAAASAVVPARTPKPTLLSVLFSVPDDGPARLLASDLEIWLTIGVPGIDADGPARVLLPAERLRLILGALPKGASLSLRLGAEDSSTSLLIGPAVPDDYLITLRSGGARWTFATEDPDFFPVALEPPEPAGTIPAGELARAIRRTSFATDVESTRFNFGGVCLELRPDGCLAVATDGRRLATQAIDAPGEWAGVPASPVVPVKACKLLGRLLGDLDGDAAVSVAFDGSRSVHFSVGEFLLSARLLEGRFPPWRDVLPKEVARSVRVDVGSFAAATAQARIVEAPESRGVLMRVDGRITLSARTADVGEARAECPVEGEGLAEPVEVTLSGDYLGEALGVLDGDGPVELRIVDAKLPVVIADDAGCRMAIMPIYRKTNDSYHDITKI